MNKRRQRFAEPRCPSLSRMQNEAILKLADEMTAADPLEREKVLRKAIIDFADTRRCWVEKHACIPTQIRFNTEVYYALKRLASRRQKTLSGLINRILHKALKIENDREVN